MSVDNFTQMVERLGSIYGDQDVDQLSDRLFSILGRYGVYSSVSKDQPRWDENDAVLITYALSLIHI